VPLAPADGERSASSVGQIELKEKLSMNYQIVTKTVSSQPLAAVRRRLRIGEVAEAWKPALDLVWRFLRSHEGLRSDGHNCFLYHHPAAGEAAMDVDFGVQIIRPFQDAGEVICTETPAGEVVMTTHIGSYGQLAAAHEAIKSWRAETGRAFSGYSWEIYGDWSDDEAKLETQVVYLLS
jgi:effector-binding domain-containing protein